MITLALREVVSRSREPSPVQSEPKTLPSPVPEIPATNVDTAAAYYVDTLGFTLDWGGEQGGIAGIARGDGRLYFPPEDKPWNLREFTIADLDGNRIRVI